MPARTRFEIRLRMNYQQDGTQKYVAVLSASHDGRAIARAALSGRGDGRVLGEYIEAQLLAALPVILAEVVGNAERESSATWMPALSGPVQ